jgi:hypothetical protein
LPSRLEAPEGRFERTEIQWHGVELREWPTELGPFLPESERAPNDDVLTRHHMFGRVLLDRVHFPVDPTGKRIAEMRSVRH